MSEADGIGTDSPDFHVSDKVGRVMRYKKKAALSDPDFVAHFKPLKKLKVPDRETLPEANAPLDAGF